MCLNETSSRNQVGKYLRDMFLIENGLKEEDALSPLFFNFAVGYAVRKVQTNQYGLKLNGTHQVLVYADDVNVLCEIVRTTEENTESNCNVYAICSQTQLSTR